MSNYTKLQLGIAANNFAMAEGLARKKARIREAARLLVDLGIEVQDTGVVEEHLDSMLEHHISDALRVLSIDEDSFLTTQSKIETLARILGRPIFYR